MPAISSFTYSIGGATTRVDIDKCRYVPGEELSRVLSLDPRIGTNQELHPYVCDYLAGKVPKSKGRKEDVDLRERDDFLVGEYRIYYLNWLKRREQSARYRNKAPNRAKSRVQTKAISSKKMEYLRGWAAIRDTEWWVGPAHERAARMALEAKRRSPYWKDMPMCSWCQVVNMAPSSRMRNFVYWRSIRRDHTNRTVLAFVLRCVEAGFEIGQKSGLSAWGMGSRS
jgi:hypothetical protein